MPVAMKPGDGGMVMVPLPPVKYEGGEEAKKPELVAEERELAESLVRIAGKYGKFDEDGDGIWAGYYPPAENKVKDIGVKCSNCVLYQGNGKCKILDMQVEDEGKCRFAIIPDGVVVGFGKKEYNDLLDEDEVKMVEDIEAKYPGEFILGAFRNVVKKRRKKRKSYKTLEEWGIEEQELAEKGLDPFLAHDASYVIPVNPEDAFTVKSILDPVFDYHRIDTVVNEYGIVINSPLDQESKDAIQTAVSSAYSFLKKKLETEGIEEKALGRRIASRAIDRPRIGGRRKRGDRNRNTLGSGRVDIPTGGVAGSRKPTGSNLDPDNDGWTDEGTTRPRFIGKKPKKFDKPSRPKPSKDRPARPKPSKERFSSGKRNERRHADRSADMEAKFPNPDEMAKRKLQEDIANSWISQGLGWVEVPRYNADKGKSSDYLRGRELGVNQSRLMWQGDDNRRRPNNFDEKKTSSTDYAKWYESYAQAVANYLDANAKENDDNWNGIEEALKTEVYEKRPDTTTWNREDADRLGEMIKNLGLSTREQRGVRSSLKDREPAALSSGERREPSTPEPKEMPSDKDIYDRRMRTQETLQEVADDLGTTREEVRKAEQRHMTKLRKEQGSEKLSSGKKPMSYLDLLDETQKLRDADRNDPDFNDRVSNLLKEATRAQRTFDEDSDDFDDIEEIKDEIRQIKKGSSASNFSSGREAMSYLELLDETQKLRDADRNDPDFNDRVSNLLKEATRAQRSLRAEDEDFDETDEFDDIEEIKDEIRLIKKGSSASSFSSGRKPASDEPSMSYEELLDETQKLRDADRNSPDFNERVSNLLDAATRAQIDLRDEYGEDYADTDDFDDIQEIKDELRLIKRDSSASRFSSGRTSMSVDELDELSKEIDDRPLLDAEPTERARSLDVAKKDLEYAIYQAEIIAGDLDENDPEYSRVMEISDDMQSRLDDVESMLGDMADEKRKLDDEQISSARALEAAEDLRSDLLNLYEPSEEEISQYGEEFANSDWVNAGNRINEVVDEHNLESVWSQGQQSDLESALRNSDYREAKNILDDATSELVDSANERYRKAEAEYDDYPSIPGFSSGRNKKIDDWEKEFITDRLSTLDAGSGDTEVLYKARQRGGISTSDVQEARDVLAQLVKERNDLQLRAFDGTVPEGSGPFYIDEVTNDESITSILQSYEDAIDDLFQAINVHSERRDKTDERIDLYDSVYDSLDEAGTNAFTKNGIDNSLKQIDEDYTDTETGNMLGSEEDVIGSKLGYLSELSDYLLDANRKFEDGGEQPLLYGLKLDDLEDISSYQWERSPEEAAKVVSDAYKELKNILNTDKGALESERLEQNRLGIPTGLELDRLNQYPRRPSETDIEAIRDDVADMQTDMLREGRFSSGRKIFTDEELDLTDAEFEKLSDADLAEWREYGTEYAVEKGIDPEDPEFEKVIDSYIREGMLENISERNWASEQQRLMAQGESDVSRISGNARRGEERSGVRVRTTGGFSSGKIPESGQIGTIDGRELSYRIDGNKIIISGKGTYNAFSNGDYRKSRKAELERKLGKKFKYNGDDKSWSIDVSGGPEGMRETLKELAGFIDSDPSKFDADASPDAPNLPKPKAAPRTGKRTRRPIIKLEDVEPYEYEGQKPTPEQAAAIDAMMTGADVKVQALAATGKTTTSIAFLKRLRKQDPNSRVVYTVFNKNAQLDFDARASKAGLDKGFVEARTMDSITFSGLAGKPEIRDKRYQQEKVGRPILSFKDRATYLGAKSIVVRDRETGEPKEIPASDVVKIVQRALNIYSISDDKEITREHFTSQLMGKLVVTDESALPELMRVANLYWEDINTPRDVQNKKGMLPVEGNHLTKIWALSDPNIAEELNTNIIVVDEAQDINPVFAGILRNSKNIQKIFVGDINQAINAWRGADGSSLVDMPAEYEVPLTDSFRFGENIAEIGNRFLNLLGSRVRMTGRKSDKSGRPVPGEIVTEMDNPTMVLTRTNAGALNAIFAMFADGKKVRGSESLKKDLGLFIDNIEWLQKGFYTKPDGSTSYGKPEPSADLDGINSLEELKEEIKKATNPRLIMLNKLISEYSPQELREALGRILTSKDGQKAYAPDVIQVSTAHTSKGLESPRVKIWTDFYSKPKVDPVTGETKMPSEDELRLMYVAVTRAEEQLDLGSLDWIDGKGFSSGRGDRGMDIGRRGSAASGRNELGPWENLEGSAGAEAPGIDGMYTIGEASDGKFYVTRVYDLFRDRGRNRMEFEHEEGFDSLEEAKAWVSKDYPKAEAAWNYDMIYGADESDSGFSSGRARTAASVFNVDPVVNPDLAKMLGNRDEVDGGVSGFASGRTRGQRAAARLPKTGPTDKEIFERRMEGASLEDVANELGVPRTVVRQAEQRHMARMRGTLDTPIDSSTVGDYQDVEEFVRDMAKLAEIEAAQERADEIFWERVTRGDDARDVAEEFGVDPEEVRAGAARHQRFLDDADERAKADMARFAEQGFMSGRATGRRNPMEGMFQGEGLSSGKQDEVYRTVQERLVKMLESADPDSWEFPWHKTGFVPNNPTNKKRPYTGVNMLMLLFAQEDKGYSTPMWAGFEQWKKMGGSVRKGEKGTQIFIPTIVPPKKDADGTVVKDGFTFFKVGYVFNVDQVDGIDVDSLKSVELDPAERVQELEDALAEVGAIIKTGTDGRAFYRPSTDEISMPPFESFKSREGYYAVLAHEMMHWTGHPSRLDRPNMNMFGDEAYAQEELIAEIAAAFFLAALGVSAEPREDHAKYLKNWLRTLKNDPNALQNAFSEAQKASDFIIGKSPKMQKRLGKKASEAEIIDGNKDLVPSMPEVAEGFASGRRMAPDGRPFGPRAVRNADGELQSLADILDMRDNEVLGRFEAYTYPENRTETDKDYFAADTGVFGPAGRWRVSRGDDGGFFLTGLAFDNWLDPYDNSSDDIAIEFDFAGVDRYFDSPKELAEWVENYESERYAFDAAYEQARENGDRRKMRELLEQENMRIDFERAVSMREWAERTERKKQEDMAWSWQQISKEFDEETANWSAEDWQEYADDLRMEIDREDRIDAERGFSSGRVSRFNDADPSTIPSVKGAAGRDDEIGSNTRHVIKNAYAPASLYDLNEVRANGNPISFTYKGEKRTIYPTGIKAKKQGGVYFIGVDEASGQYRSFNIEKVEGLIDGAELPVNPRQPGVAKGDGKRVSVQRAATDDARRNAEILSRLRETPEYEDWIAVANRIQGNLEAEGIDRVPGSEIDLKERELNKKLMARRQQIIEDLDGFGSGRKRRSAGSKRRPMSDEEMQAFRDGQRLRARTIPKKRRSGPDASEFSSGRGSNLPVSDSEITKMRNYFGKLKTPVQIGRVGDNDMRGDTGQWNLPVSKLLERLVDIDGNPLTPETFGEMLNLSPDDIAKLSRPDSAIKEIDAYELINGIRPDGVPTDRLMESIWGFDRAPYWYDVDGNLLNRRQYEDIVAAREAFPDDRDLVLNYDLTPQDVDVPLFDEGAASMPDAAKAPSRPIADTVNRRDFGIDELADFLGVDIQAEEKIWRVQLKAKLTEATNGAINVDASTLNRWSNSGVPTSYVDDLINLGVIKSAEEIWGDAGRSFDASMPKDRFHAAIDKLLKDNGIKISDVSLSSLLGAEAIRRSIKNGREKPKTISISKNRGKAPRYDEPKMSQLLNKINENLGTNLTIDDVKDAAATFASGRSAARNVEKAGREAAQSLSSGARPNNGAPEFITPRMQNELMDWASKNKWSTFAQSLLTQFERDGYLTARQWEKLLRFVDTQKMKR